MDDSLIWIASHYFQSIVIQVATMMINLICVAFIGMASAFNVGRMGIMRVNKSFLEMAKKSVSDLSDAELLGKRCINDNYCYLMIHSHQSIYNFDNRDNVYIDLSSYQSFRPCRLQRTS